MTISMSELTRGQVGRVLDLQVEGGARERLVDLGLLPGARIERVMASPAGDPICYRVRGAMIALRNSDTRQVRLAIRA